MLFVNTMSPFKAMLPVVVILVLLVTLVVTDRASAGGDEN